MKFKRGFALAVFLLCFITLFSKETGVKAAYPNDITNTGALIDSNIATVVGDDTTINAKYKFYPEFIKDVTTVETFGNANWELKWSPSEGQDFLSFIPTNDNQKGQVGVMYRKVGKFNGKWIDLKITVDDWDSYSNQKGNISYSPRGIRHATQNYKSVTQTWQFMDNETGNVVSLDGYLTFADIDVRQGIRLSDGQIKALDGLYATNDRWLKHEFTNGWHSIFDSTNNNVFPDGLPTNNPLYSQFPYNHDKFTNLTITFSNTSKITFDWTRAFIGKWDSPTINPDFNELNDVQVFFTTGKKLARTEILKPEKYISVLSDDKLLTENVLNSYKQKFSYHLVHQVHDEYKEHYYGNYEIKDTIPEGLNIESIRIQDEEGKDVSGFFSNNSSGNTVLFKAKSSALKSSSFYGRTYKVKIDVVPSKIETLNKLVKNDAVEWINTLSVTVDKVVNTSNPVSTKLYKRNVDVWHVDKINNEVLEHTTDKKFDGEEYSYSTKDTFKKEKISYMPVPVETKKGTIAGGNVELKFYYQLPFLDVNMKHIQIYTANAQKGLPVKLDITKTFPYGLNIPEVSSKKVKIELFKKDSKQPLISKEFLLKDIPDHMGDWTVPKDGLEKDKHNNYIVKISGMVKGEITSSNPEIDTDGYTSSEETVKVNAKESTELKYKGVIMTEREVGKEMKVFYETLTIPLKQLSKQKTGYGFELKTEASYNNELAAVYDIKANALVDKRLIDSHLNYVKKDGNVIVPLDETKKSVSSDKKNTHFTFELPHINVEQKTGTLFTDQQVKDKDSRIKNALKDGKRRLYAPIWAELGDYSVYLKSSEAIGVNQINFEIANSLNLFAYMYGTIGSETLKDDEVLLEPVDPRNPFPNGKPSDWTDDDIAWLKR
ncbi:hypothetical protein H0177_24615 [Bacillus cereus]|uniref:hypothetical protein n=1 Tax=Bacillus cereus TaxID=1396 RepID=UPI001C8E0508|nr:hypothetical protein [Bacillus cereus]MBY0133433.1 hypothetical protein [Bacillus cereus]